MELLIMRPEEITRGSAKLFSDQIINRMMKVEELEVIGISNATSLACTSVRMSSNIASIFVKELCLDYIQVPILGKMAGIFFTLGRESLVDWDSKKKKLDRKMNLTFDREGQLVVISKRLRSETMIPLCLWKLSKSDFLKIVAAGISINRAATLALEITKGKISKEPVGIELMTLSTIKMEEVMPPRLVTGLEIYLKKGEETKYSEAHSSVLRELRKRH